MNLDLPILRQLAADQQVPVETVVETVTRAIALAYKAMPTAAANATVTGDAATGKVSVLAEDGTDITPSDFGRLAAAAARQAMVSWLRDVERVRKVGRWAGCEGTVLAVTVRGLGRGGEIRLDVPGAEAVMPIGEITPGEALTPGSLLDVFVLAVNATDRGTVRLTVSRRQPGLVSALFAQVVPELASGAVRILAVAREPGARSKVAFTGPVGGGPGNAEVLIGPGGERIRSVMAALGGEKVDLVEHSADLAGFAARALTPGRVRHARLTDASRKLVEVTLDSDQVHATTGRAGANLRLASRLTGAKITLVPR